MNIFSIAIIVLFLAAGVLEVFNGNVWMAIFYGCSALINVAVILK